MLEEIAQALCAALLEDGRTLSLAESCTGGMIASALVGCPGVSGALLEGCVCYSNAAKVRTLGVSWATLDAHGAVSEQTASEMVRGMAAYAGSDCAIAITGIAGPGGGSAQKPVGLVYIATLCEGALRVSRNQFGGDRLSIRTQAACTAMRQLLSQMGK